jgi:hypothetical protein
MGQLRVLDPTGHTTIEWDSDDDVSVEVARNAFDNLKA